MRRRALVVACVAMLAAHVGAAAASGGILERAFLHDRDGTLTLDTVRDAQLEPFDGPLRRGYRGGVHWVRLVLEPGGDAMLRYLPGYLDQVDVYLLDPRQPGGLRVVALGDRRPWPDGARASVVSHVAIGARAAPLELFVRIETTSTTLFIPELVTPERFTRDALRQGLLLSLYLGLLLALVLIGYVGARRGFAPVVPWFVTHLLSTAVFALGGMGVMRWLLPEAWWRLGDVLTSVGAIAMVFTAWGFYGYLAATFRAPTWVVRSAMWAASVPAAAAILFVFGFERTALSLNAVSIVFVALWAAVASVFVRPSHGVSRLLLRGSFAVVAVGAGMQAAPVLGFGAYSSVALYAGYVVPVAASLVVVQVLLLRAATERERARDAVMNLKLAWETNRLTQQQLVASERFVGMLGHELRSPLSVISMVLGSSSDQSPSHALAQVSVQEIDRVLGRCQLTVRLERGDLGFDHRRVGLLELVEESLANWDRHERVRVRGPILPLDVTSDALSAAETELEVEAFNVILDDLIDNAVRYGDEREPVEVSYELQPRPGGWVVILRVRNAVGRFGAPDQERAFEKYVRGPRSSGTTGAGLGLYLARALAERIGASISLVTDGQVVEAKVVVEC